MIHWLWLIAAFIIGGVFMFFALILFMAAAINEKNKGWNNDDT